MAGFRSYLNRMHSLPLSQDKKQKEWETIQVIAKNNNFPKHLFKNLTGRYNRKQNTYNTMRNNAKHGLLSLTIARK
jgi:hypothetical protein